MTDHPEKVGALYFVATPIGNLEDMTPRAVRTLAEADLVAAEDTRRTRQLLTHFGLSKPLISYYRHNEGYREAELLEQLKQGKKVALVSDAGMPGISDPGSKLVLTAIKEEIPIIPIPGATALITALVASGQATDRFVFEGFLPRTGKLRKERLAELAKETRTMVFYESPHHLVETLRDLSKFLEGSREVTVARELTKVYEEFWRGTLKGAEVEFSSRQLKGEFTLVVAGGSIIKEKPRTEDLLARIEEAVKEGSAPSEAIRETAREAGVSRRELYKAYQDRGKK